MNRKQKINRIKMVLGGAVGLLLLIGLAASLKLKDKVSQLFSEATGTKADIRIDAAGNLGVLPRPWTNLAQGGEEADSLPRLTEKIKPLEANYIRLDHIYDFYGVVNKDGQNLSFNWSRLDAEVRAITAAGAKPLLALSYLPPGFGADTTAAPDNWDDWYRLVKATIEHYSGKNQQNISDVYYEVWNEPDLFGSWKYFGDKNYLQLYRVSARAANDAAGTQPFKLGGPATTGAYPNWIEALLNLVDAENLRLDFISWHRYSWDADNIDQDVSLINRLLEKHPRLALKEKLVTEWGPDPQNHPAYDNRLGASHLLASIIGFIGNVHKAFVFEIMDGRDPAGQALWGRYGLLTHYAAGLTPKPRYDLLLWLNQLAGDRLPLTGQGSWVKAVAVKTGRDFRVYLVNYDSRNNHQEAVPVTVVNLEPGNYQAEYQWFQGKTQTKNVTITAGTFVDQLLLQPNDIVRLKLSH